MLGGSTRYVRPYVDDSLSTGTSSPLCLSHFKTDLFCQRVYKRNGVRTYVFIDWSFDAMKDGLIVWLLRSMYMCLPTYVRTYICSCIIFKHVGSFSFSVIKVSLFSHLGPRHVRSLQGKLTETTKW